MAAKPSLPHTCEALVGLEAGSYHAAAHSGLLTPYSGSVPRAILFSTKAGPFYLLTCISLLQIEMCNNDVCSRATLSTTLLKFTLLSTLQYYRPQTRFGLLGSIHTGLIAISLSLARIAEDVSLALVTLLLRTQGSFTPNDSVTVTVTFDRQK